jgi:hypothetical protein
MHLPTKSTQFDLQAWHRGYGTASGADHAVGDADRNGAVDGADLADWEANYGTVAPLAAGSAALPEPASAVFVLMGAASICLPRRRRLGRIPTAR